MLRAIYRGYQRIDALSSWLAGRTTHSPARGWCPICEGATVFVPAGDWLRDRYYCLRCLSIPRFRALIYVLGRELPDWRRARLHESSPGGAASDKLRAECPGYVQTQWFAQLAGGALHRGVRCENLEQQTFDDHRFDVVVAQDVFEHVLDPAAAFREVARTLRPGGALVFTIPWWPERDTLRRAHRENGRVVHDQPAEFHDNPVDRSGSLVVHEWGRELPDWIAEWSGLRTAVHGAAQPRLGIVGQFCDVFVSRKA